MGRKKMCKTSYSRLKRNKQIENIQSELLDTSYSDVQVMHSASRMEMPRVPDGGEGSEESRIPAGQSETIRFLGSEDDITDTSTYNVDEPSFSPPREFTDFNEATNLFYMVKQDINDNATRSIVSSRLMSLTRNWKLYILDINYISRCLTSVEQAYGELVKLQTITCNMPDRFNLGTYYTLKCEQLRLQAKIDYVRDNFVMTDHKFHIMKNETNSMIKIYELFRLDAEEKRLRVLSLFKELENVDKSGYLLYIIMSNDFKLTNYIDHSPMYNARIVEFYKKERPTFLIHQIAHIYLTEFRSILMPIKVCIEHVSLHLDMARVKLVSFKTKCYRLKSVRIDCLTRLGLSHYEKEVAITFDKLLNTCKKEFNLAAFQHFIKLLQEEYDPLKSNHVNAAKVPVQTNDATTSTASMETNDTIPSTIIYASPIDIDMFNYDVTDFYISVDRCITPPIISDFDRISDTQTTILLSHRGTDPHIAFTHSDKKSDDFIILECDTKKNKDDPPETNDELDNTTTTFVYSDDNFDQDTVILSLPYNSQETPIQDFPTLDERLSDFNGLLDSSTNSSTSSMNDSTNIVKCTFTKQTRYTKTSETSKNIKSKIKRRTSGRQKLRSPPPYILNNLQYYSPEAKSEPSEEIDLSQANPSNNISVNKDIAAGMDLTEGKSNERHPIEKEIPHISIDEEIAYGIDFKMPETKMMETVQQATLAQYAEIKSFSEYAANACIDKINTQEQLPEKLPEQPTDELIVQFTPECTKLHAIDDIPKEKGKKTDGLKIKSKFHKKQKQELVKQKHNNNEKPLEHAPEDLKEQYGESTDTDKYPEQKVEQDEANNIRKEGTDEVRDRIAETLLLLMSNELNVDEFIDTHLTSDEKLNKFFDRKEPISAHEVAISFLRSVHDTILQHKQPRQNKFKNLNDENVELKQLENKEHDIYKKKPNELPGMEIASTETVAPTIITEEQLQVIVQTAEDTKREKNMELVIRKKEASEALILNKKSKTEEEKVNGQALELFEDKTTEEKRTTKIMQENDQINKPTVNQKKFSFEKYQSNKAKLEKMQVKKLADTTYGESKKHSNHHFKLIRSYLIETNEQVLDDDKRKRRTEPRETRQQKRKFHHKRNSDSIERWPELDKRAALVRKIKHRSSNVHRNVKPHIDVIATTYQTVSNPTTSNTEKDLVNQRKNKQRSNKTAVDHSTVIIPQFEQDQPILKIHPLELNTKINDPAIITKDPKIVQKPKLEPPQVDLQPVHTTEIKSRKQYNADIDPPSCKVKVKSRPVLKPETARHIICEQQEETPISKYTADAEPSQVKRHKYLGKFSNPILSTRSLRILDQRKIHAKEQPMEEVTEKQKKDAQRININNKKAKGYKFMKLPKLK